MGSSPGFVSNECDCRPLQTRFRFASGCRSLSLPPLLTRWLILKRHAIGHGPSVVCKHTVSDLFPPLRGSFHLSVTVLVHYRSSSVFNLGRWSSQLPTGLACPVVLRIRGLPSTSLRGSHPVSFPEHSVHLEPMASYNPDCRSIRFGLFRFRSPTHKSFSFLGLLRCFSSPVPFPWGSVSSSRWVPHSDIAGYCVCTTRQRFSQCTTSFIGT